MKEKFSKKIILIEGLRSEEDKSGVELSVKFNFWDMSLEKRLMFLVHP